MDADVGVASCSGQHTWLLLSPSMSKSGKIVCEPIKYQQLLQKYIDRVPYFYCLLEILLSHLMQIQHIHFGLFQIVICFVCRFLNFVWKSKCLRCEVFFDADLLDVNQLFEFEGDNPDSFVGKSHAIKVFEVQKTKAITVHAMLCFSHCLMCSRLFSL